VVGERMHISPRAIWSFATKRRRDARLSTTGADGSTAVGGPVTVQRLTHGSAVRAAPIPCAGVRAFRASSETRRSGDVQDVTVFEFGGYEVSVAPLELVDPRRWETRRARWSRR
jgi:hypothetical protein